mgnify:CR=1 FL=1
MGLTEGPPSSASDTVGRRLRGENASGPVAGGGVGPSVGSPRHLAATTVGRVQIASESESVCVRLSPAPMGDESHSQQGEQGTGNAESGQHKQELGQLESRVRTLERLVTDDRESLARRIDDLK